MSGATLSALVPANNHSLQMDKIDGDAAVEAVLEQYEDLNHASEEIDQFFIFPEGQRPDIVHDSFDVDLPVIDLSPVFELERLQKEIAQPDGQERTRCVIENEIKACEAAKADLERAIRTACEEYGFFQIVNHGFPMKIADQLTQSCRQLFELPLEVKMTSTLDLFSNPHKPPMTGYTPMKSSTAITRTDKSHIWNETFVMESPEILYPGTLERMAGTLWPEEPRESGQGQQWRSSIEDYGKQASGLSFTLLELMASSFGLPQKAVHSLLGYGPETQAEAMLRVNHYPVCTHPELTWGLHGHTDPNVVTLLHQDDVGGLQISFKDGTWHGVRPIPGAFVVNVGDYLQAFTNGRLVSAQHRVVANSKAERFSTAYFVYCGREHVISPMPELVTAEHPLQYRPFKRIDYIKTLIQHGLNTDRRHHLDKFFGA